MATTPIIVTPNLMADPDGCLPGTRQEMANFIATAITVSFGSSGSGTSYATVVTGSTTPAPEQQNSLWLKTEVSGRQIGWFTFFNGAWKRGGFPILAYMQYQGPSSVFDGTGKGNSGTQVEGFHLCNGQGGTPDLRNKFIIGANSYNTAWVTNILGLGLDTTTGGESTVRLTKSNLPELTFTLPIGRGDGGSDRFQYGNTTNSGTYDRSIPGTGDGTDDPTGAPAVPHSNLPPFFASAIIQFTG